MRRWVLALDHGFDAAFGAAGNPLKQLGAVAFLLLWLLALSGVILYAVLDTSASGAYASIEALSQDRLSVGSALRGLHRYGADAFVLVMLLHLVREWMLRHERGFRRYAWITGVVLLPLAYASAIGGFWLHWDRLGQYSAQATAEWLDALPFLASPLARNFLDGAVGDRLFSLFVFVHLGLPLLLVFVAWAHVQRLTRPVVFPRAPLVLGTTAVLLVLAFALPVQGQGAAELGTAPQRLALDWLLLFVHPLADVTSAEATWFVLAAALAGLLVLPLLSPRQPVPVARVDVDNCNGCGRCVQDCPFAAITLVPHPRGRGVQLAQVQAALCASCGICAGACPSSTPFRKRERLVTGIDLPQAPVDALRARLQEGLAAGRRQVVFGCAHGAQLPQAPGVLALALPCIAQLPPSFVEYAVRAGAHDVVVAGCREGGCEFRLGPQWMDERLRGAREPHLRAGVPASRWRAVWADAGEEARLRALVEEAT